MALDYDELNTGLIEAQAGTRAAECHGFISGYFCASNRLQIEVLRDQLVSGLENAHLLEQCYALVDKIAEDVFTTLQSNDIDFQPLLPDDEEDIRDRTQALSEWCGGFISGLGVGGLGERPPLNPDCDEFIKDMVSLSRIESEVSDDEESEAALFELVEYIRVGTLMLYQEWYPQTDVVERPEVLH